MICFNRVKKLALIFLMSASSLVHAQGIPVVDAAQITTQITNQVESIAKWVQQFQQMKQQIDQAKTQFESMTGSRGMAALLDNAELKKALPDNWQQLASTIKETAEYHSARAKYPQTSLPKLNAMYDVLATQSATFADLHKQSNARLTQIRELMAKIDSANDPAAKQDLANRLISEQNAIQANQNLVTVLSARHKQELEEASENAAKEITCAEFKKTC